MTPISTALEEYTFAIKRLSPKTQDDYKQKLVSVRIRVQPGTSGQGQGNH